MGAAWEDEGAVRMGNVGSATYRTTDYQRLVIFAANWINERNRADGIPENQGGCETQLSSVCGMGKRRGPLQLQACEKWHQFLHRVLRLSPPCFQTSYPARTRTAYPRQGVSTSASAIGTKRNRVSTSTIIAGSPQAIPHQAITNCFGTNIEFH